MIIYEATYLGNTEYFGNKKKAIEYVSDEFLKRDCYDVDCFVYVLSDDQFDKMLNHQIRGVQTNYKFEVIHE